MTLKNYLDLIFIKKMFKFVNLSVINSGQSITCRSKLFKKYLQISNHHTFRCKNYICSKKRKISQVQLVPLYFGNITRAQYGDRYSTLTSYRSLWRRNCVPMTVCAAMVLIHVLQLRPPPLSDVYSMGHNRIPVIKVMVGLMDHWAFDLTRNIDGTA